LFVPPASEREEIRTYGRTNHAHFFVIIVFILREEPALFDDLRSGALKIRQCPLQADGSGSLARAGYGYFEPKKLFEMSRNGTESSTAGSCVNATGIVVGEILSHSLFTRKTADVNAGIKLDNED